MRRPLIRGLLATILVLGACSPAPSPNPSSLAPSAALSATIATADTIRIAMPSSSGPTPIHGPPTGVGPLSNANFQGPRPYSDPGPLLRMVGSALYKFDDHLEPAEMCRPHDVRHGLIGNAARDQLQLEAVAIRTAARGEVFRTALKAFIDAHP